MCLSTDKELKSLWTPQYKTSYVELNNHVYVNEFSLIKFCIFLVISCSIKIISYTKCPAFSFKRNKTTQMFCTSLWVFVVPLWGCLSLEFCYVSKKWVWQSQMISSISIIFELTHSNINNCFHIHQYREKETLAQETKILLLWKRQSLTLPFVCSNVIKILWTEKLNVLLHWKVRGKIHN